MGRVILPKRDGEFSLKYDSRLCKRFVADAGDVRVPAGQKIFADMGQPPIVPAEGSGVLPAELAPTPLITPTPAAPTTSPTPTPGFEAVFAVTALLAVIYGQLRKRRE